MNLVLSYQFHRKYFFAVFYLLNGKFSSKVITDRGSIQFYVRVKGHLEPTHLKSSPLFTFSTELLGQDSPSFHICSLTIGSRFTTAKIKLGEDSLS